MKNWHHLLPSLLKFLEVFWIHLAFDHPSPQVASFLLRIMIVTFNQRPGKGRLCPGACGKWQELLKLVLCVTEPESSHGGGDKSQCAIKETLSVPAQCCVSETLSRERMQLWEGTCMTPR